MKTKIFKTILITAFFGLSLTVSVKIVKSNFILQKNNFLIHSKGKSQHFINSFIN